MKIIAAILFIALMGAGLFGCGGCGSSSAAPVPPVARHSPLLLSYYCAQDSTVASDVEETSTIWTCGWGGSKDWETNIQNQLANGKAAGARTAIIPVDSILIVDGQETDRVRGFLRRLQLIGLLQFSKIILFVGDELEQKGFTDEALRVATSKMRGLMAEFPELQDAWLATNYGCGNQFVGYSYFDLIGCDRYDRSAQETLGNLKSKAPGKMYMQFVGVVDPFHVDPLPYVRQALCDGQITVVVYFIKWDFADTNLGLGSANNGLAPTLRAASALARTGSCGG